MKLPPFVAGKRLYLRPVVEEDVPLFTRWINSEDVARTVGARVFPFTPHDEMEWYRNLGKGGKSVVFSVVLNENDRLIGNCALMSVDWQARHAELGIMIGEPAERSRGYGREAVGLLLRHAFETMNLHRVELRVLATNEAGLRCYRACGFVEEGRFAERQFREGRHVDEILMAVLRERWARETTASI